MFKCPTQLSALLKNNDHCRQLTHLLAKGVKQGIQLIVLNIYTTRKLEIQIVQSSDINKLKGRTVASHFDKNSDVKGFHSKFHKTD